MHRGYLKLWRKIEDSISWSRGLEYRGLICSILVRTSRKKTAFRGEEILPGQFGTVMSNWCDELGLNRQKLQRMSNQLVEDGFISVKNVGNRFSIVSVLNWEGYQESKAGRRATSDTTADTTGGQPVGNQRATSDTTEQEYKNLRTKNKTPYSPSLEPQEEPPLPTDADSCGGRGGVAPGRRADGTNPRAQGQSPRQQGTSPRQQGSNPKADPPAYQQREGHPPGIVQANYNMPFEEFWAAWLEVGGRPSSKEATWNAWQEREKFRTLPSISELQGALLDQSQSHQWQKENGKYKPSANKWLRDALWTVPLEKAEDEIDTPESLMLRAKQARGEAV